MRQPVNNDAHILERLSTLEAVVEDLQRQLTCRRRSIPPPPPERWGRDRRSEDLRPPHTCGLPRWSR